MVVELQKRAPRNGDIEMGLGAKVEARALMVNED